MNKESNLAAVKFKTKLLNLKKACARLSSFLADPIHHAV
jgi:hypothetical protein